MGGIVWTVWLDKTLGVDLQSTLSAEVESEGGEILHLNAKAMKTSLRIDEAVADSLFATTVYQRPFDSPVPFSLLPASVLFGGGPDAIATGNVLGVDNDLVGKMAPALVAKATDGTPLALSALKGKPVLLEFGATWCQPCRESMTALEKLYREYKDQGLEVIQIDKGEDRAAVEELVRGSSVHYPVAPGSEPGASVPLMVLGYPAFLMIGRDGTIVANETGFSNNSVVGEADLRRMLERAGLGHATKGPVKKKARPRSSLPAR